MLLMALPNEHLLTFSQYKDAKTLFAAIHARFSGNDATKKTQKTLLKQMYENFNALSIESLDSIFNRLQKIVSQLAILGENISLEDLNLKILRSMPSEWNTHVVVWRNKPDLDTMSFNDLYNNFKIVKQEVKKTVITSSSSGSQNMAFVTSLGTTNKVDTTNIQVSTINTTVSTASTHDNTANLSDATIYAFLANQPNGSYLVYEDLEQIYEDDLEKIDLKWQLALLSMRARRHYQRTGLRNQESRPRNQDSSRKTANVEETSSKAMVAIDGADSEVHNDKTYSNTYLKTFETLKTHYDNLRTKFNKSEFDLTTYKRGLASVEEQLVFYKKNEVMLCDQIIVLKRDTSFKDSKINALNIQIEKLKKEKESNQIKINNFKNASKSLDKLIGSQMYNKSRKGVEFPPPTGLFSPPTIDLFNSGLEEFQQPEFEGYGFKANKTVLTKSDIVPISAARQSSSRAAAPKNRVTSVVGDQGINVVKSSACWVWRPKSKGDPQDDLKDTRIFDSGCTWHMTGNKSYLTDYQEYDRGFVAFGGSSKGGKITGKGKIRTGSLDFEDVYFVKELKFNIFSVSHMCDRKNSVFFTEAECLVLSPNFKLPDESQNRVLVTKPHNKTPYELLIGKTPIISIMRPFGYSITVLNTLDHLGSEINFDAGHTGKEKVPYQEYILLPLLHTSSYVPSSSKEAESSPKNDASKKATKQPACDKGGKIDDLGSLNQHVKSGDDSKNINSTNSINTASPTPITVNAASLSFGHPYALEDHSKITNLEDTCIFDDAYDDRDKGATADYNNLETVILVSHIPSTRVNKDHPKDQTIGEVHYVVLTRSMLKQSEAGLITFINKQRRTNHKDFQNCLFSLSDGTKEDLPSRKKAIKTKWVFRNKKDQKGIVDRNKAKLVAQGHRQEEGIDYDKVFALVARIEAISVKTASTPMETHKPLSKDADGTYVNVHLYRALIRLIEHRSLPQLTTQTQGVNQSPKVQSISPEGSMMNEVDIENLTIEQYLMLTQENQTREIARTESGRMITKDIENMTIAEYMEYEVEMKRHPWGYAQSYTRSLGSTTLGRSKVLENKHHLDKLKINFPPLPLCFKHAQPLAKNTHKPLEKDQNDYDLCARNSHHEDDEVSSDVDVDEWLNAEMGKRMTGQDKEEEEDALIDILKTVVKESTWDDPYSRRFDVYKEKFDSEIEQLATEYDLKVEHLKADNTVRVNQIVTIFLIESLVHILDQNRYQVDTSLIHLESCKSPTAELFNVDSVRNKREKDKIGTKPDQIKKKREAWRSPKNSRAVSVDRARKTKENAKRMVKNANTVGISHETSIARSPQQNGAVERQAVATACYTQNRSIIRLHREKTPYELLHNKLPDLSFLHVFGALRYPTNDSENLGKLQPKADIRIFIGYAPTKKAFQIKTDVQDELLKPSIVDPPTPKVIAPITEVIPPLHAESIGSPSSTTVDQDAPSPSKSQTTPETQSSSIPQDVKEDIYDIEVVHMRNDPLFSVPIPKVTSDKSSSTVSPHTIVQPDHQIPQHNSKWIKDHPLDNIIGQLSRPVSIRFHLHEQALFCYYDAFLTSVEPKTYKDALTQSCWIEVMQEELNEFERLKV
nr:hypothetical protein [Tanacetum cinerariifolium]